MLLWASRNEWVFRNVISVWAERPRLEGAGAMAVWRPVCKTADGWGKYKALVLTMDADRFRDKFGFEIKPGTAREFEIKPKPEDTSGTRTERLPKPREVPEIDLGLRRHLGKAVAVWCARHTYCGMLKEVGRDAFVLGCPYGVEFSGLDKQPGIWASRAAKIPGLLTISKNAVEQACRPNLAEIKAKDLGRWSGDREDLLLQHRQMVWDFALADREASDDSNGTLATFFGRYLGQALAIWSCRCVYRGILREILGNAIILDNANLVECTGSPTDDKPAREIQTMSKMSLSLGAVEMFCQPTWA